MARYGMLINAKRCVECFACRIACQMINSKPSDESFIRFEGIEKGVYPNVRAEVIPLQCQHCEDAPCVGVCPTGASFINENGMVLVDEERCIGCHYCMMACPYQARIATASGAVDKCRFCYYEFDDSEPHPACVATCVTQLRVFGDLDDPESDVSKAILKYNAIPIAGDLTKSKIFYVR